MTRVLHTGDTHIGYRQYHSPDRRRDFLAAFERVVEDAIADEVDAVVHAGDLFHDRQPALDDVHGTIEVLRELRAADIPFLAIVGNHERTRDRQWLDLFETLGLATRLGDDPVEVGDTGFYGLDFVPRSQRDALDLDFAPTDADHTALVAHGLFTPFNTDWDIEAVLGGSPIDFDAVLLGDDHQPDRAEVGDTWVTYCGSTERTSAAEREDRGYNLVEFDGGVSISRRGIETRDFVILDLELSPGEGADRVRERLREEALEDAVVLVRLEGDGADIAPAGIEEFAQDRGALVARVTDKREFDAEEVTEISFADPDEAVRDRLRDLGLSEAALAIDETVRGDAPKSNVRGLVTDRIRSIIEDDPGALERSATIDDGPGSADPATAGADDAADAPATGRSTSANAEDTADPTDDDRPAEEAAVAAGGSAVGKDGDGDGQVTMDDYL